jgi:PIN domain nuclease of toxin-antitoxin system
MSFNRRLPFSTRYVPIDKQKLINNEFQFATMAPRLQSLVEKYGLGLGAATLMGTGAVDTYNKYTIDPVIDMAKKLELDKLGLNFKAPKDTSSKKQNGGWLNKYK